MTTMQAVIKRSNPNELSVRLASKLLAIILALVLVMGLLAAGIDRAFAASAAHSVAPRGSVSVKGENVRLGDVFNGVVKHADFVLAPAPRPGEVLVWNTPTLHRIATAFNLPWRPGDGDEVRIRRAASLVDADTLRAVVRDHLAAQEENAFFNVRFTSETEDVVVPGEAAPRIDLADFSMQPAGGTFSAVLRISGEDGAPRTMNVRGVAERMLRLPVLRRDLRNGDIISERDIDWTLEPARNVRPDILQDAQLAVGATPRRSLRAGEPLRADSIEMPRLVSRGDIVTMVFREGGMYITARGRALEDGAMGQVVKVSNTGSNRQIEARVTAHKQVTVN